MGRLTAHVLPDGSRATHVYNADGTLASRADFNGATTAFTYDVSRRLIRRSDPDGSQVTFTYTPVGLRSGYSDSRGTTSFGYDQRDRMTAMVYPDGRRLDYAWDAAGNRTSVAALVGASTLTTTYAYDPINRLTTVTDSQGGVYTHSYDANGNRVGLDYPSGVDTATTFDSLNRLTDLTTQSSVGAVLQSYVLTLDPTGRRTRIDEADGTSRSYAYDGLYRLLQDRVTDGGGAVVYQQDLVYDPVGNRLSLTEDDGAGGVSTTNYTYDSRDRLLSEDATAYGWDANGNLLSKSGIAGYSWDSQSRLRLTTLADGTEVRTLYDPDGNRVRRELTPPGGPTETTEYLVDPTGALSRVVVESNPAGDVLASYVWGDELLSLFRPATGERRYYHADAQGSVRLLTDATEAVTDSYTYTAFGELLDHTGLSEQSYRFTGEPFDPNIGFYYNRARWLDVSVGRFASFDLFPSESSDPSSLHRYLYAAADPVNNLDPTGNFTIVGITINLSIRSILTSMATGALFGAVFGALDAYFAEESVLGGALSGAIFGAFLGPLGRIKALQKFLFYTGMALGATSTFEAFMDGDTGLALFRGITFVAGLRSVLASGVPRTGDVLVYRSINPANGQVQYVGITKNLQARAAAHLREKGIRITKIAKLENLSRDDARAVEQVLIEFYGIGKKGGSLMNLINSISPKNPKYADALRRGRQILAAAGYPGF